MQETAGEETTDAEYEILVPSRDSGAGEEEDV